MQRTYKIEKSKVLERLRKNRESHQQIFEEAQGKYKEEAIKELEAQLESARKGVIRLGTHLNPPVNQLKDYDRMIDLLDSTTDTTVELTEQEFGQYMRDEWHWKHNFLASNVRYSKLAEDTLVGCSSSLE